MVCLWQKVSAEDWDLLGLLRAGVFEAVVLS